MGSIKIQNDLASELTIEHTAGEGAVTLQSSLLKQGSVGVGQTWQDVTASRSAGVTYTNTTGKPILVYINSNGSGSGTVVIDGLTIQQNTTNVFQPSSFIVPDGSTYVVTWGITRWSELR